MTSSPPGPRSPSWIDSISPELQPTVARHSRESGRDRFFFVDDFVKAGPAAGGLCAALLFMACFRANAGEPLLGVLQATASRAADLRAAGMQLAVCELAWSRFEPSPGKVDPAYVAEIKDKIAAFRQAGQQLILDPGIQYPPAWLLDLPGSRFVNQYGDAFLNKSPGKNIANAVFNAAIRQRMAGYYALVFRELGSDFFAVRLGGGWYNELNYPPAKFRDHTNCYWAYDPIAQGRSPGLPEGVLPCPVPGWKPGTPGAPESARRFAEWYMESLRNYHDWQIASVHGLFPGRLMMMYPSWGIRPGQLDAAISANLSGTTPAESNGEIPGGFDFSRYIQGISLPGIIVHTTWVDADPGFGDDFGPDPAGWSPLHFLSSLARQHSPPLPVSAENTGGGGEQIMRLCHDRVTRHDAIVFLWAFEHDLTDNEGRGLRDFRKVFDAVH